MHPQLPVEPEHTIGDRDLTTWRTPVGRWLRTVFGALSERLRNALKNLQEKKTGIVAIRDRMHRGGEGVSVRGARATPSFSNRRP